MQHHPTIAAAIGIVAAAAFTEADESARHGALIAFANHRFQLFMGETFGVVEMYEEAAVRKGISRDALEMERNRLRPLIAACGEEEGRKMAISLNNDVLKYLSGQIDEATLRHRQCLYYA